MSPVEGSNREPVRHIEVSAEEAGQRLDRFLERRLGNVPRSHVYRLVRRGEVRVNRHRATPGQRLNREDTVRIPPVRLEPVAAAAQPAAGLVEAVRRTILYEDDRLLVLDKPAGVAVHGGSGVSFGVIEALRAARPGETLELAHRLDRGTSGCLLIARRPSVLRILHTLLREGGFEKGYLTLVAGQWNLGRKRIDAPLRTDLRVSGERTVKVQASGKPSVSEFRPVEFFGARGSRAGVRATLLEVALLTGRTHQIRVHAAHAGHPVAGDEKYGDAGFNRRLRELGLGRPFLHAHRLSFEWPEGGTFSVSAPLPPELRAVIDRLSGPPSARRSARPTARRNRAGAGSRRAKSGAAQ